MANIDIESPGGSASALEAAVRKLAFQRRGCRATRSTAWTAQNFTTATAVQWDAEDYDTDSIHSTSSNTTRLTVPSGWTRVRLTGFVRPNNVSGTSTDFYGCAIRKNGSSDTFVGTGRFSNCRQIIDPYVYVQTAELTVVAGDYFEFMVQSQSDTSSDIGTQSFFEMELIL